jgi:hypothetical protein
MRLARRGGFGTLPTSIGYANTGQQTQGVLQITVDIKITIRPEVFVALVGMARALVMLAIVLLSN